MGFVSFIVYAVVAAIVVFLSIKLSEFVDLLDKKTNVSGAFLGAILLAAVTSLPELFTSLTSTLFVRVNRYVIGNILGSNLFNMALFFIIFTIFFKKVLDAKVNKSHVVTLSISGLMYVFVALASFLFDKQGWLMAWINPISILILGLYVFSIIKTPKEENKESDEDEKEEVDSKLTVKQIIILFAVCSVLLIGASIGLTYCVDWIIREYPAIGQTFGGALFLGVATSLPELTATITLCRKGNYNAAVGDIVGSSVFNFFILSIADFLSFNVKEGGNFVGLYKIDASSLMLIICGIVSNVVLLAVLFFMRKGKLKNNNMGKSVVFVTGLIALASYIVFTILSNTLTI